MPAHSSHLLQPLDIGCFAPLKRVYGTCISDFIRLGINHVDKIEFLRIYPIARAEALSTSNIRSGFTAAGLVPYKPDRVLQYLTVQVDVATSPPQPTSSSTWKPEMPYNIIQLKHQAQALQILLKQRSQSPPSPVGQVVNQLIKGAQIAMHSAVFLATENKELRTANAKQKAKRNQTRSYIAKEGVLTAQEGFNLTQAQKEEQNEVMQAISQATKQRAPPRCSLCNSLEHKAPKCPKRQ